MSGDAFMLELFAGELRSNCATLKTAFSPDADSELLENAARSLKSSSKLVGFVELAAFFGALEKFFGEPNAFCPDDANAHKALKLVEVLAECPSEKIGGKVDSLARDLYECAAAGFSPRRTKAHTAAIAGAAEPADIETPDIDTSMKELFVLDTTTQIELVLNTLVELEGDFAAKPKLESLMRASHSIKGAARAVGLGTLVELTHQMENCFSAALEGRISIDDDSLDVFFKCADFILDLCRASFDKIDRRAVSALVRTLKDVESGSFAAQPEKSRSGIGVAEESGIAADAAGAQARQNTTRDAGKSGANFDSAFVRISVENINSIMAAAAENLVQTRKFEKFQEEILALRSEYQQISSKLEEALNMLGDPNAANSAFARLERINARMREQGASFADTADAFSEYARKNVSLSTRLYTGVLESRMRPFSDIAQRFPRMVRDFSKSLAKNISFEISGSSVSIDRDILEKVAAPLTHILRNACDHGIETPRERVAAGKPPVGRISVRAAHSSGMFVLTVSDDGRGIDKEAVKREILAKKLVPEDILAQMHEEEIFEFLFLPAFTTKREVTEISGRGVGLDVVQTMLREVGGSVGVSSREGEGSVWTLKLPITRSVLKSLSVEVDGQPYAFPLASIDKTFVLRRADLKRDAAGDYALVRGRRINIVSAARVLGFDSSGETSPDSDALMYVVAVAGRGKIWGFVVDSIPVETELVVRVLDTSLGKIACISAAALGAEGLPVLIFDIDDMLIYASRLSSKSRNASESADKPNAASKKILVVDDSATVREVEKKILESFGFSVDTAVDGVDGWNLARIGKYDLLVSDIDMPRMTGFELVAKLRKINRDIPVVIVSYKDRPEDKRRARDCGADEYLTKSSFQDDSFVQTVRRLLDGSAK